MRTNNDPLMKTNSDDDDKMKHLPGEYNLSTKSSA